MTNPFKSFFLFCSGANGAVLEMKGCEVEHNKYAGIGVTILFTATLAALSGGYAMFTVFHDRNLSFAFGLLWGLIIFNLDRFIVSSIRKNRLAAKGEFLKALPRLLLAIFISIVITRPLELKLFEVEIQGQITKDLTLERAKLESDINTEYADIANIEAETEKLRNRRIELENELHRRVLVASNELEGGGGTKHPGDGPEYKKRTAEVHQAEEELKSFNDQYAPIIKANEAQTDKRKKERDDRIAAAKAEVDNSRGLLKRLEALSELTTLAHLPILLASGFIMLLFISLETAPILVKLFSSRGPYDDYMDTIEHRVYASQQKEMSDLNDDINTNVALSKQLNANRLQWELQMYQQTMASLQTLAQQSYNNAKIEIAEKAIAQWKKSVLNRLSHAAPLVTYSTQQPSPVNQSAQSPSASAQNIPQPSAPASASTSAGASTAAQPTGSPQNNGGTYTSGAAPAPLVAAQTIPQAGAQPAGTAGTQTSSTTTSAQAQPSTAQPASGAGQQSVPGATQTAPTP